jgi:hypothetical protein
VILKINWFCTELFGGTGDTVSAPNENRLPFPLLNSNVSLFSDAIGILNLFKIGLLNSHFENADRLGSGIKIANVFDKLSFVPEYVGFNSGITNDTYGSTPMVVDGRIASTNSILTIFLNWSWTPKADDVLNGTTYRFVSGNWALSLSLLSMIM